MPITTANVKHVAIVDGKIVMTEGGGTSTVTTNSKAALTDVITLLGSTDSQLHVRQLAHQYLRQIGFTGTLGGFGG